ncbi:succinate dehydrogenase, cytochrome b556 subunit [Acidocella aminolytica]|jgi:succinate dehydrogenase / fumarate reductase cytochrome b subunit|uniref:Succinate dehydrogenase cytochrome b556 subunit n=1 Tax=Acidocella aminolytica 101 = DSM 11237 TaxID=1120923 RepID=A0A0D6PDK0_9PROT|nr:succinate dehydrogenase, cytochrome b556 subunit [Acidocella aminolytica]GAN79273.1 succinate dehydrogenase cytochrome b subunit [Acidocella aminolytica 101 = DSM 11237]GBQ39673.1 succinate dehydrogenase cytochrome b subunit [Acidocella aminolytica 101 = DSM 11237]SHE37330.1 succinate dehydrogenase subunit C [Acidocella aminolytica 101 = DSM 11237]
MKDVREALMIGHNSEGKLVRRPLSPHLQVYKPQISSATSIFHRITGVALSVGTILMTLWLICAASGDAAFSVIQAFFASWIGMLILFGFTIALFYHFCNGIRHLAWDAGKGFELPDMHRSGKLVFAATIVLTVAFWVIALLVW